MSCPVEAIQAAKQLTGILSAAPELVGLSADMADDYEGQNAAQLVPAVSFGIRKADLPGFDTVWLLLQGMHIHAISPTQIAFSSDCRNKASFD